MSKNNLDATHGIELFPRSTLDLGRWTLDYSSVLRDQLSTTNWFL